jgi:hypothetical protein
VPSRIKIGVLASAWYGSASVAPPNREISPTASSGIYAFRPAALDRPNALSSEVIGATTSTGGFS